MTRTQFIVAIAVEIARQSRLSARKALPLASGTLRDSLADSRIEFGDPRYDWGRSGAKALATEALNP